MTRSPRLAPLLLALALCAAGCGGAGSGDGATRAARTGAPGSDRPAITLGTRTSSEQILLGQLYEQALEARGFRVALKQNIGSTAIADAALRSGQIDLYPEYLGTFDRAVAGDGRVPASVAAALAAGRAYAARHGFRLLAPTPFSDVDALAVLPAYARAHGLRSIADLASVGRVALGAPPELLRREAGLVGLARAYGIRDVAFAPLTIGLQYQALDDGRIDVADVRTTDGQLQDGGYVLLSDPANVFGIENVTPVVAAGVLQTEGPAFAAALDAVSRELTLRAMQQMNAAVALDGRPPADVAQRFLHAHGLV